MIILTQTTDKIQVKLSGAVSANQLHCYSVFRDTTTTSITPSRNVVLTNNTTAVDLVGSPSSSTQRNVEYLNVYNADTSSATVTFLFNDNGTTYEINVATLLPGEKVEYQSGIGFKVLDCFGSNKISIEYQPIPLTSGFTTVILGTDYTNSNATLNTLEDITGYSFPVTSGKTYWFRFQFLVTPALASTGHRVTINGPTTSELSYYTLLVGATNNAGAYWSATYNLPATTTATTPLTGGMGYLEGIATFSADGTLIGRVASEVASSGVTIKAGSVIYYRQLN
jgi:hypothetical protein